MIKSKQIYILILVLLLFPAGFVYAAWLEPSVAPTGGNAPVPVYTEGTGQNINQSGTLHVDPSATNAFPFKANGSDTAFLGTGGVNGLQGDSSGNALFGNLSTGGGVGGRAVYGKAVDADDYGLYSSGGLGLGIITGDIYFLQASQNQGIAWPRESDGASLYGIHVNGSGELRLFGHGGGINFLDQNQASRLTVSEAGVVNVVTAGSLKVTNVNVCLQDGTNCPANVTPNLQLVTTAGNTTSNQIRLTPSNVEALRVITDPGFSPLVLRNNADNADLFRVNQNGDGSFAGNLTVSGQSVCRQNGTNCPAPPAPPGAPTLTAVLTTGSDASGYTGYTKIGGQFHLENYANNPEATIDFDPHNALAPGGNYLLVKSGLNATYGEKWHLRVNRSGETLLGSNLFVGTGGSVASMTPYNDPTVNASWKIGRVGGVNTIEATPGGGAGSVGDINLKSGTLKVKYINNNLGDIMVNDTLDVQYGIKNSNADNGGTVYVNDTFKTQGQAAFGGWNIDPSGYIITTPSIYTWWGNLDRAMIGNPTGGWLTSPDQGSGTLNAVKLCIQGDCKANWAAVTNGGAWTTSNGNTWLSNGNDKVGIGRTPPNITARLHVQPATGEEGLRIISSNFSPFIIRNSSDTSDLARIDQLGNLTIAGIDNRIGGAQHTVPLAVKTDSNGLGIEVECGVVGCSSFLQLKSTNSAYTTINSTGSGVGGVGNLVINPSPFANYEGGKVGIGTTAPNSQLHIKTVSNNAEMDIQSGSSPYWAIYQDNPTDDLRFWNNNIAVGDKNALKIQTDGAVSIPNKLVIGNMASNPYLVTETFAGETALGIRAPDGTALAYFGANPFPGFTTPSVTITSDLYFSDTSGNFTGFIANNGGVPAQAQFGTVGATTITATNFCFGATCKNTNWGPPSSAYPAVQSNPTDDADTKFVTVPNPPPPSGPFTNYLCDPGWVMIGIRNESPSSRIICGKMW